MSNSRVIPSDPNQVNNERWTPPLPDAEKPVDSNSLKCVACGRYHGSVNRQLNCLRSYVLRFKAFLQSPELKALVDKADLLDEVRAGTLEFYRLSSGRPDESLMDKQLRYKAKE